jgi:hypothetical protein
MNEAKTTQEDKYKLEKRSKITRFYIRTKKGKNENDL